MYKASKRLSHTLWILLLAPLTSAFSGAAASGAPTVLDFEDIPAPAEMVRTQYSSRGVLFSFSFLSKAPLFSPNTVAHSGTQVMRVKNPSTQGEFSPEPMVIEFTSPQRRVRMFAGIEGAPVNGTLRAFDANGAPVGQVDGPKSVAADVFTTMFEVSTGPAIISRVELLYDNATFEAIDDLEFDGEPPAPPPPTPPVVQITTPLNGADLDVTHIDIAGMVTGQGLLSPVFVTIEERRPPDSTAPPFRSAVELTGSGTTRQFSLPGFGTLGLGPIKISVEAENIAGQKGTASVNITNLPVAIKNRFNTEGGAAVFGEFRFGVFGTGCKIAVYEFGAISVDGAGGTHLIRGAILLKWLALPGGFGKCPRGEERDGPAFSRVQDFDGGRIYTASPVGTFFVPPVFVDVIDKHPGGESLMGVPLADPTDSAGVMQTWLFQRFTRLDRPDLLPSTLEIRGTPKTLSIERQGGDWIVGQLEPSDFDRARNKTAATIWESFPCTDFNVCSVESKLVYAPPNIQNIAATFCNDMLYIPVLDGFCFPVCKASDCPACDARLPEFAGRPGCCCCVPPEWVPVRGQYDVTPVFGAIVSAHMADIDNGFTHETHNGTCPDLPDIIGGPTGLTCVSDYEFFVRPLGPQIDVSPLPSLFGRKNTTNIKTEYEVAYAALAHNFLGTPAVGDLVHTTGRWIVDCGHDTYKTELHPIFSFARMKTVVSETNGFTGLEDDLGIGGKPATRIGIWVNGWYPGGEGNAIEFDAFPPPRPNPDARLHVIKPVDFAAGGYRAAEDVTMEFNFVPAGIANHIHLRFTAPRRENTVTAAGEFKFQDHRQYWGIWYLYWGE